MGVSGRHVMTAANQALITAVIFRRCTVSTNAVITFVDECTSRPFSAPIVSKRHLSELKCTFLVQVSFLIRRVLSGATCKKLISVPMRDFFAFARP